MKTYDEKAKSVLSRIEKEKEIKAKRNRAIIKYLTPAISFCLLVVLALVIWQKKSKSDSKVDNGMTQMTSEQNGVYYSKADEKEISSVYDENGCYVCSILSFDDKLYTSSYTIDYTDKSDIPYDSVLLDSLGTVSVNHGVYFAEDKSELSDNGFFP